MTMNFRALAALGGVGAAAIASTVAAKNWDDWSAPASIEALSGSSAALNTGAVDGCAAHSADGLTIVFNSNRTGNFDLYTASRSSKSEGFGAPVPLPSPVNTSDQEACASFGPGNRLYFASNRDDPAYDLYVAKLGPNGWSDPERLGPNINTNGMLEEAADFYTDDDGREVMIFTRRNPAGTVAKIYYSIEGGPAFVVQGGPHSSAADARGSVTGDGLTMFFDSTRTGTLGGPDLYYASRSSTSQPFGTAIHLQHLSSSAFEARPFISKDGSFLTYSSARTGSESPAPDIWFSAREKVTGN